MIGLWIKCFYCRSFIKDRRDTIYLKINICITCVVFNKHLLKPLWLVLYFRHTANDVISMVESGLFDNPEIYITPPDGVQTDEDQGGLIDNLNGHQLQAEAEVVVRTNRYYRTRPSDDGDEEGTEESSHDELPGPSSTKRQRTPASSKPKSGARKWTKDDLYRHVQQKRSKLLVQAEYTVIALHESFWFISRPCQHDDGYIDGRSRIKVHTDERTQVHSARSSLTVTHPSSNHGRHCLTSVNVPLS